MGSNRKHFRCSKCDIPMTLDTGVCLRCRYLAEGGDDGTGQMVRRLGRLPAGVREAEGRR